MRRGSLARKDGHRRAGVSGPPLGRADDDREPADFAGASSTSSGWARLAGRDDDLFRNGHDHRLSVDTRVGRPPRHCGRGRTNDHRKDPRGRLRNRESIPFGDHQCTRSLRTKISGHGSLQGGPSAGRGAGRRILRLLPVPARARSERHRPSSRDRDRLHARIPTEAAATVRPTPRRRNRWGSRLPPSLAEHQRFTR